MSTPHASLFRFCFERLEHARDLIRAVLPPEVVAHLDPDGIRLVPGDGVNRDLAPRASDLLFEVPFRGDEGVCWLLCEHQSESDPWIPFRTLEYPVLQWTRHRADIPKSPAYLPPLIVLVVHNDPTGWRAGRRLRDLYRAPEAFLAAAAAHGLLDQRPHLDSLCDATEAELEARTTSPLMRLVLWSLRCRGQLQGDTRIDAWSRAFQELVAEDPDAAVRVMQYHFLVTKGDSPPVLDAIVEREPSLKEAYMTPYDRIKKEGEAHVLLKQLHLKFGPPSPSIERRVRGASEAELDALTEKILTATSLEELFVDHPSHQAPSTP